MYRKALIGALFLIGTIVCGGPSMHVARAEHPLDGQVPEVTPTVTLEGLVDEALEHNPAIQAARSAVDAKQSLVVSAKTLPDPTITVQTMGDPAPFNLQTGDPSSARTVSIEQEIPFPGKLGVKGKIAGMEAEAERWNYEQTRCQVIADLKQAYYDLYLIYRSLDTVRKDKGLLERFEQIAQARYRVGQGVQQDVLKAQVEISKLIDRSTVLEQRKGTSEALINSLLDRQPDTALGKPAELQKTELHYSLEQLYQHAQEHSPLLKMQEREIDRSQFAVHAAEREYYPDFSMGFTYFNREGNPAMYGYMLGAKVPLYFWRKQRPEVEGARSGLASAQRQRVSLLSSLYSKLKDGYLRANASEQLITLYGKGIIPQATLSLESAVAGYQVGKVDFLTLLDNLVTLLEYELKYYEVLTDFQKVLAQLEPLVGVELTR